jgi:DNA-binding CsgD family transcriptional regulator
MNFCDLDSEVGNLQATEEHILSSFIQRLIEIASAAGARGSATSPTAALNAMGLPAIALDRYGSVVDANAAAEVIFDDNIRIKNRRLFVRDPDSRTLLKEAIDQLARPPIPNALAGEPVVVPRMDKLPVIVRIWPFEGPSHPPDQDMRALLTLNALGPRPGPPAAILAKAFRLTPSEAKLACIIARGAPPNIAARELKISRETARNQLKSVFAKTNTHRQSELVALLMQVW